MERVRPRKEPCSQACCSNGAPATPCSRPAAPARSSLKTSWKGACVMATARWNGAVLAESDHCRMVEGNYYFPPKSVRREYLKPSRTRSLCFWKELAITYLTEPNGAPLPHASCSYPP